MDLTTPLLTQPAPVQQSQRTYTPSSPSFIQSYSPYSVHSDNSSQEIEIDQDLQLNIHGYKRSPSKVLLANISYTISGGIIWILARWFPKLKLQLNYDPCALSMATHAYVENQWHEGVVIPIRECQFSGRISEAFPKTRNNSYISMLRTFEYRYIRFIFSPHACEFVPNDIWRDKKWESVESALDGILDSGDLARRQVLFKSNNLQIEEKPTSRILMDEVLHPFFLFQIASIILWSIDNYYYYASVIFLISLASILVTLYETKANMRKLRKFSTFSCTMKVWRFGAWMTLDSVDLVPGDVFEITPGIITHLPADAVLLNGDCIVNESMLTGESIPVSKSPIADSELQALDFEKEDPASISSMSRYFLFSGTKIIRSRASAGVSSVNVLAEGVEAMKSEMRVMGALAMVVRTGFNTTKGNLIRSMLFPKPNKFKFYRDSFRFIGVLGIIAAAGFVVSFYNFVLMGVSWGLIFVRALDLITIVVPPALPATMAIGTSFAISRLKKGLIYCISPPRVNICGKIDLMCFDKTGTLTEEGLDVLGFRFTVPTNDATLWPAETFTSPAVEGACRFSRLYTQAEEVVPRLISEKQVSPSSSAPQSFSKLSGVSLKYATIPGHPNAEKEYEYPLIICAMATCHSIKVVDGDLVGDPLDLKMFSFTGWEISENAAVSGEFGHIPLVEPPVASPHISPNDLVSKIGVVRIFDFVSSLRRMSVIIKRYHLPVNSPQHIITHNELTDYEIFVKGAPEVMESICDPKSIPNNYNEQLRYYSHHGYRVIAIGHSVLSKISPSDIQEVRRSAVEENIQFLGFIIFENKLKVGTAAVVKVLNEANIRQVMVTGDNVLTAISVSRACGLVSPLARIYIPKFVRGSPIDPNAQIVWENVDDDVSKVDPVTYMEIFHEVQDVGNNNPIFDAKSVKFESSEYFLAITGDVFAWMLDFANEESIQRMLIKCQIFARMSPDQKHFLVERFQELGYCVGFTGDGSNDCGALKNADVGLSLSEAEASVAAPFTSQSKDLSCVLRIIREGRAALVTSFSCFKYMALYSLIQFTSVSLLYSQGNNLGDFQFLYIDIFIIIPIAIFMGRSGPHPKICRKRPTASLMSKYILTSLVGQISLQLIFQAWTFHWVQNQKDWYVPGIKEDDAMFPSMENSVLFYISTFQYMTVAFVYNTGAPYRENSIKNIPFMINLLFLWGFTAYIIILEPPVLMDFLALVSIPFEARMYIFGLILAHFLVSWICEAWIFKQISKLIDWIRWSFIYHGRRSAMEAADHIDSARWKRRLKWQDRGKIFKLIFDDLGMNQNDRRQVSII